MENERNAFRTDGGHKFEESKQSYIGLESIYNLNGC